MNKSTTYTDIELLKKSMSYIKKEQLVIILKELLHLKYILNFYKKETNNNSNDDDIEANKVKEDMFSAHHNIKALEKDLIKLKDIIKLLNNYMNSTNSNIKDNEEEYIHIKFILIYDFITQNINNALTIMELIYKKVYQIFEEAHNQYIPKPTLGRRFSNNNLLKALKDNYQEIISLFSTEYSKNNKNLILSWNYRDYFQLEINQEHLLYINNNKYGNYINLPYWYYELPILLPSITHEAVRVALLQKDSTLKKSKEILQKRVNNYLTTPHSSIRYDIIEIVLKPSNRLIEKVIADIVSLTIYKEAYIYSIFHDLASARLSKLFNLELQEKKLRINDFTALENIFNMRMRSWNFDKKRDIIIIRLYILLEIARQLEIKGVDYIYNFLNSIYPIDGTNIGIHKIYHQQSHYYDNYIQHTKAYKEIVDKFIQWINSGILQEIRKTTINKTINIDFSKLWNDRFKKLQKNKILHKNEFRKILHKKTIDSLKRYADSITGINTIGELEEIGTPYAMTFVKVRKELECSNPNSCQGPINCLDCYLYSKFPNYYNCFGIYDLLKIESTNWYENIDKALSTVVQKFLIKVYKQTNTCETCLISNKKDSQTDLKYFESKYSLMQIFPTISSKDKKNSSHIHALYNIELDYDLIVLEKKTTEQPLEFAIKEIVGELLEHKDFYKEVTIYKSLGPKDLMIFVKDIDEKDLLKLNPKLTKLDSVKRTFTTILSNQNSKKNIQPNNQYQLVSYLRVKLNNNDNKDMKGNKDIKSKILNLINTNNMEIIRNKIEKISLISGVLDIHITWKANTNTKTVFKFYDILIKEKLITDFQTKFNKTIYTTNS